MTSESGGISASNDFQECDTIQKHTSGLHRTPMKEGLVSWLSLWQQVSPGQEEENNEGLKPVFLVDLMETKKNYMDPFQTLIHLHLKLKRINSKINSLTLKYMSHMIPAMLQC